MARLSQGMSWEKRVKVNSDAPKLDPKNPVHAAITGKLIRDINNGNYEDVANLQITASALDIQGEQKSVKVGEREVTTLTDGTNSHDVCDPATVKTFMDKGFTVVKVSREDIMG